MINEAKLTPYSHLFVMLLACLSSTPSAVLAQDEKNLIEEPGPTWSGSTHGFSASLVFTNKPDRFFQEWESMPSEHAPRLHTISAARRGATATGLIIFSGCKVDQNGNCNATVSFKVFRPDGSIYANLPDAELWKGKPGPPQGALQIGVAFLGFRIELDDALGNYLIEAIVRDEISEIDLLLTQVIHVLPAEATR
ncbi:hypothetical protein GH865_11350 [Rhodocyclus tenuis]|uniref:hypothetical protein n=1 Tax=Rhodocyclus gracilis TaxID=2929842 RepID=UPI001298CE27|nr:hypothetical protein [Rhodocyclus gracilis]MRD73839.1 hypothetical protein [Rhodocyclus gracilis]